MTLLINSSQNEAAISTISVGLGAQRVAPLHKVKADSFGLLDHKLFYKASASEGYLYTKALFRLAPEARQLNEVILTS